MFGLGLRTNPSNNVYRQFKNQNFKTKTKINNEKIFFRCLIPQTGINEHQACFNGTKYDIFS